MPVIVQKYGGSSVASVDKIGLVADQVAAVKRAGNEVVVVISAMGKTTDELLSLAHQVDESPPRRELDMLLSTGERISMALMSMAIQKRGCDAISFTGSQSGIITNDRHFDARIIDVRPHRVEDELARGRVVIIAGYQGMSYKREITTLGRGGSDTTALAMAAALGAARAEIYSDVDGVYSADPRKVKDAKHLPELSYEEMQEMADAGAKVLHSKAVEFARDAKIAIHARSTFSPGRETVIHADGGRVGPRSVAALAQVAYVTTDRAGEVLRRAREHGVAPLELRVDESRAEFCVATADSPDWTAASAALRELGAQVDEGHALVSVLGRALVRDPEHVLEATRALSCKHSPIQCSDRRLVTRVAEEDREDAVRALHAALIT